MDSERTTAAVEVDGRRGRRRRQVDLGRGGPGRQLLEFKPRQILVVGVLPGNPVHDGTVIKPTYVQTLRNIWGLLGLGLGFRHQDLA